MKKLFKIVAVLVLLGVIAVAAGLWYANRYVQSPAFKEQVHIAARKSLGTDVQIKDLRVSLFRGVELRGVTVANPAGYNGALLTADELVLRYRFWPLLQKRVEVEELTLRHPVITIAQNAAGQWNYEALRSYSAPATLPSTSTTSAPTPSALDILLSQVTIDNGVVVIRDDKGMELLRLEGITLSTDVQLISGAIRGQGNAGIVTVTAANKLFARQITSPITLRTDAVQLTGLRGTLADGNLAGTTDLKLTGGFQYSAKVTLRESDVTKLLQEAGTKPVLTGKLQADVSLSGRGGLETINGVGTAEIVGGKLIGVPLMEHLSTLLQSPQLRDLQFSEFRLEFAITNNTLQTPVIRVVTPQVQITGFGAITLGDYTLNHTLTLAMSPELLGQLLKQAQRVFTKREDGWLTLTFHVTGPYDAPKTDLAQQLISGAGNQLLERLLK